MRCSTTSVEISQIPVLSSPTSQHSYFNDGETLLPTRHPEEHPLVEKIRAHILQYRLQSAAYFDISIDIHQTRRLKQTGRSTSRIPSFRPKILFHDFSQRELYRTCRLMRNRKSSRTQNVSPDSIQVRDPNGWTVLANFLEERFPVLDQAVQPWIMYAWWNENGKVFHWTKLPTELKERIVQFCLHRSHEAGYGNLTPHLHAMKRRKRHGPHEVIDQLGAWSALLGVSRQVRAITLRLCFMGSRGLEFDKGLCLIARSYFEFSDALRRLGKYYQIMEPASVPTDEREVALAKMYRCFPRIFLELNRFATFRHGVRRINLQMDFLSYLHFFRVTVGGFERYWRPYYKDYEVFQQLPHLSELIIVLPDAAGRLEDRATQPGPPLFFDLDFACPRILHRLIYEQAAKILAVYDHLQVQGFIDDHEQHRFLRLRRKARMALKFRQKDLDELYTDDGGGVALEEITVPGSWNGEPEKTWVDQEAMDQAEEEFWPPKCRCSVRCRLVILRHQHGDEE